jgi:hypothetical protein
MTDASFPTGWFFPLFVGGPSGTPAIILPAAAPTVRHVLTKVEAFIATQVAAISYEPLLSVYDDATLLSPPTLMAVITDGSVGSVDRDSWEGQLIGSPGKPMTVSWNASVPTGITMMFRMWGFDL